MRDWRGRVPSLDELGELRRHQKETYERAINIADRETSDRVTVAHVTPGGGKSFDAVILSNVLLLSGRADRVVVVVPRDSLRGQMHKAFTDREHGFNLEMTMVTSDVSQKLMRANAGYITTYQAINKSPDRHIAAASGFRTLYVLDEFHHLTDSDDEGKGWKPGIAAVTESAEHVFCMSGGLARDDGKPVMFVSYDSDRRPIKHITYTRRDALGENAVIELRLDLLDGDTEYKHKGRTHEVELSTAESKEKARKATRTALELDEYRYDLLGRAFRAWIDYRLEHGGYRSQFIVICDSQAGARNAARWLRERDSRFDIGLAISDEGAEAARSMKRFRERSGTDILVTCQMAYEGLDAPWATHLAYMTKIRSVPWMDQAFARITRFNKDCGLSWKSQRAFAFAPCDPAMKKYLADLQLDQDDRYRERERVGVGGAPFARKSDFTALKAEPTDIHVGGEYGLPPREIQEAMRRLRTDFPGTQAWSAQELERLARRMGGPVGVE